MQRYLNSFVVAVWVLVLCGGVVNSDDSCDKGSQTRVQAACTDETVSVTLPTTAESETTATFPNIVENTDSVDHSVEQDAPATDEVTTDPPVEVDDQCMQATIGEDVTPEELRGSWQVMSGYSREFVTSAFCPEVTFDVNPENPKNITVSWTGEDSFRYVLPRGEMTMVEEGKLVDKDGYHEINVITLGQFLVLRVRNPIFWRVLYLYPLSDHRGSVLGELLGFMMPTHSDFMNKDGPAWYICTAAYIPVKSQDRR